MLRAHLSYFVGRLLQFARENTTNKSKGLQSRYICGENDNGEPHLFISTSYKPLEPTDNLLVILY